MLFHRSFLWKGCRFGEALCHVDVTFRGIFATSAVICFCIFLGLYRIFDNLRQTKTYNQDYKLLTIRDTSKSISFPFRITLTSKSHHSSCSFRQSGQRAVDLPVFRVVCLNCWEGTRPKIVCHQPWQCRLFLSGKSGEHPAKIISSKLKRADLRMLRWLPMGSSAQYKVDPSLSSSNAFWTIISKRRNFMEANSIVGVCCFAAAVHNTSIRHNEAFSHIGDCGDLRFLCFHTSCCPSMTSQETRAHSSSCSVVGRKSAKFCNFENL